MGVSTDEFNETKGKKTVIPFPQRVEILEAISYVDLVIEEKHWEQKIDDIKQYEVDIFVMGDDWNGKFDELKEFCEVCYLPPNRMCIINNNQGSSAKYLRVTG